MKLEVDGSQADCEFLIPNARTHARTVYRQTQMDGQPWNIMSPNPSTAVTEAQKDGLHGFHGLFTDTSKHRSLSVFTF